MDSKSVTLRRIKNHEGSRYLGASLNEEGSLVIEGQDLGLGVERFFGDGLTEYEWSWTIRAEHIPQLLKAMGAPAHQDVLEALQTLFQGDRAAGLKAFLDLHSIPYETWSRVGD